MKNLEKALRESGASQAVINAALAAAVKVQTQESAAAFKFKGELTPPAAIAPAFAKVEQARGLALDISIRRAHLAAVMNTAAPTPATFAATFAAKNTAAPNSNGAGTRVGVGGYRLRVGTKWDTLDAVMQTLLASGVAKNTAEITAAQVQADPRGAGLDTAYLKVNLKWARKHLIGNYPNIFHQKDPA